VPVKFRDYYEVLGVPRNAKPEEIKRAYRKLARKHHPDLHPPGQRAKASERFQEINEAHEVLSDPEKRAKYDALGANWKSGMDFTQEPSPGRGTPGSGGPVEWEDFGQFSDFFNSIFGGSAGGTRGARRGGTRFAMPGLDVEAELPLTLDELLRGGKRRITLNGGRSLDVDIPLGLREGTVLRLAGQGEPGVGGGAPGDLFLRVRPVPDARYRVTGDDIEMDLPLWPWQALLGSEVRIETPEGAVNLKVPAGTQGGRRLRLRGRGLPRKGGARGDFYAVTTIVIPENPSAAEREAYETLKRHASSPGDRPARE